MGLLDRIKADAQKHTSNPNDFGVAITFTAPDSPPVVVTVYGTTTKHCIQADRQGVATLGKNASCTVSEQLLTDEDYPVRNDNDEVYLKGHKVTWTDSAGLTLTYIIDKWYSDEKLGLIVCILGNYKAS